MEKAAKKDLEKLKKEYLNIQEKYNLPSFEELNKDFQIEKAVEFETDYLIREIRKFMAEKFSNYLRFIEAILNPVNVPMFVFSIIKTINLGDKDKLTQAYKELAKIEVRLIEIDIDFDEEKEAAFIIDSYKIWQKIKKDLFAVISAIKDNWDSKFEMNHKGYFG